MHAGVQACDDGNQVDTDALSRCVVARCGDGLVHEGVEACDDGNEVDSDAAPTVRSLAAVTVWRSRGSKRDDSSKVETDGCRGDCTLASCGDEVVQAGVEACDDGNEVETTAAEVTARWRPAATGSFGRRGNVMTVAEWRRTRPQQLHGGSLR